MNLNFGWKLENLTFSDPWASMKMSSDWFALKAVAHWLSITTENFVEFEEKHKNLSSAKGVQCIEPYGRLYSDSYQSLGSIYFPLMCTTFTLVWLWYAHHLLWSGFDMHTIYFGLALICKPFTLVWLWCAHHLFWSTSSCKYFPLICLSYILVWLSSCIYFPLMCKLAWLLYILSFDMYTIYYGLP